MTSPVSGSPFSNSPFLPSAVYPTLPLLGLSEDEARIANSLAMRLFNSRPFLELNGLYYDGLQKMQDLGISIPPQLAGLRTVMGWPKIGVDAVDERLSVEGFRFPRETDTDQDLLDIWAANNMAGESGLAHLDALIYGRCYIIVGPSDDDATPLMTCESPLNMTAVYDARLRKVTSALQIYLNTDFSSDMYGREVAALYLPGKTIHMTRDSQSSGLVGAWDLIERDDHGFSDPPVVRLANRQRVSNRDGQSEITPAWRNLTDSACRTLLGMEVSREFHAAPRRYILGASEEHFTNPDGTSRTAWETYLGKVWALERDENGELPQVGQFQSSDPSVYTKIVDTYTRMMAAETGLPPHYLGIVSDGNPASADAIRMTEARLSKRAERKQTAFGEAWQQAMKFALLIRDGQLPDDHQRIECDWEDPGTPTPGATTDALSKQIASGMVPSTSDVVLKRAGYSAQERAQLDIDRKLDGGASILAELSKSLQAKEARVDGSIARELNPDAVKGSGVVNPETGNVEPPAAAA